MRKDIMSGYEVWEYLNDLKIKEGKSIALRYEYLGDKDYDGQYTFYIGAYMENGRRVLRNAMWWADKFNLSDTFSPILN